NDFLMHGTRAVFHRAVSRSCPFYYCHLIVVPYAFFCFFFNDPSTTEIYTLSLHDALPISIAAPGAMCVIDWKSTCGRPIDSSSRSEEHTSELQSRVDLVCRLLLEKKKKKKKNKTK